MTTRVLGPCAVSVTFPASPEKFCSCSCTSTLRFPPPDVVVPSLFPPPPPPQPASTAARTTASAPARIVTRRTLLLGLEVLDGRLVDVQRRRARVDGHLLVRCREVSVVDDRLPLRLEQDRLVLADPRRLALRRRAHRRDHVGRK